jgi:DNA-binding transcriptional regulator YiaG
MPNFATALKDEIIRRARKELRSETEGLKKASSQYRSDIATLKRRIATLEKQLSRFEKQSRSGQEAPEAPSEGAPVRFSAKGLSSRRQRLGLSAAEMGALLGVSAQTVYNWEAGKSRPRAQQLTAIAALRGLGKRQAKARLAELAG